MAPGGNEHIFSLLAHSGKESTRFTPDWQLHGDRIVQRILRAGASCDTPFMACAFDLPLFSIEEHALNREETPDEPGDLGWTTRQEPRGKTWKTSDAWVAWAPTFSNMGGP